MPEVWTGRVAPSGWVAGGVRARGLARRRLGGTGAAAIASSTSAEDALAVLASSPYRHAVTRGATLGSARRGVAATLLRNLRALAGAAPVSGANTLRAMAGWFEISNVDELVRRLTGEPHQPPYHLGTLASAWPRLMNVRSVGRLREALAESPWGDPGSDDPRDIAVTMRLGWAWRVAASLPNAAAWARGAAALLVAGELGRGRALPRRGADIVERLLGPDCASATTVDELRASVPHDTRWCLNDVDSHAQLPHGEAAWWQRVRANGAGLLAVAGMGTRRTLGAAAVLAHDAWLVRRALSTLDEESTGVEELYAYALA